MKSTCFKNVACFFFKCIQVKQNNLQAKPSSQVVCLEHCNWIIVSALGATQDKSIASVFHSFVHSFTHASIHSFIYCVTTMHHTLCYTGHTTINMAKILSSGELGITSVIFLQSEHPNFLKSTFLRYHLEILPTPTSWNSLVKVPSYLNSTLRDCCLLPTFPYLPAVRIPPSSLSLLLVGSSIARIF